MRVVTDGCVDIEDSFGKYYPCKKREEILKILF